MDTIRITTKGLGLLNLENSDADTDTFRNTVDSKGMVKILDKISDKKIYYIDDLEKLFVPNPNRYANFLCESLLRNGYVEEAVLKSGFEGKIGTMTDLATNSSMTLKGKIVLSGEVDFPHISEMKSDEFSGEIKAVRHAQPFYNADRKMELIKLTHSGKVFYDQLRHKELISTDDEMQIQILKACNNMLSVGIDLLRKSFEKNFTSIIFDKQLMFLLNNDYLTDAEKVDEKESEEIVHSLFEITDKGMDYLEDLRNRKGEDIDTLDIQARYKILQFINRENLPNVHKYESIVMFLRDDFSTPQIQLAIDNLINYAYMIEVNAEDIVEVIDESEINLCDQYVIITNKGAENLCHLEDNKRFGQTQMGQMHYMMLKHMEHGKSISSIVVKDYCKTKYPEAQVQMTFDKLMSMEYIVEVDLYKEAPVEIKAYGDANSFIKEISQKLIDNFDIEEQNYIIHAINNNVASSRKDKIKQLKAELESLILSLEKLT